MKGKKVVALMLAAAMAFSLTACGGSSDDKKKADSGSKTESNGDAKEDSDQYINTYMDSEPTTLDPSLRSDTYSSEILISCMEGLIRIEQQDGEYVIAPGDAESWENSEDGTVWTFHLGKDRKWSDGEPVTAEQYVYSLQRSADPETGCPNSYFLTTILNYDKISTGDMKPEELGVKAVDENTLEITLTAPMPSFLESTDASIFYPQRKDLIEKYGEKYGTDAETMVWNGPFKLDTWVHNSSLELVKNDQYWDKDNVSLDKVNYQILSDTSSIANAFDSGQIDLIGVADAERLEQYKADSNVVYTPVSGGQISFIHFNTKDKLLSNKNIRQAFSLAIDREDMNDLGFSNLREPLYGWIAPALSVDGRSMRAEAGDTIKEQQEALEADGKTAKDLLLEGMKELGLGDDPSKLDVTFSLGGVSDWHHTFGEYLQQMYKETLGIELKINFKEWSIYSSDIEQGNYQMGFMSWGAYYNDPYDMLSIHLSDANQVYTFWANEEYDKLAKAGVIEQDPDKRMQYYIDAEKIMLDDYVTAPVATSVTHRFTKSYVHDKKADYGEDQLYFYHTGWKYTYTSGR